MIKTLLARLAQGHRTAAFPAAPPVLPERFRGRPTLDAGRCPDGCQACVEACPTDAVVAEGGALSLDMGRCLFCQACADACPEGALAFSRDHQLAARQRADLVLRSPEPGAPAPRSPARGLELSRELLRLFGRSLKLRQVSAGGCNGCEADVNVLSTIVFDVGRFGIQIVASPRHADGLLITGPIPRNMHLALQKTYEAVPAPKIVIAVGACAISGGPYRGHPEVHDGLEGVLPVDLYVPGCPPHPYTILEALIGLLGRRRS
jgi:Ni,Fe-hydrogenase III small subunit/formate hydrogenlyase subunit 6/NADH:ubiquinone oxidoreductase subunit I